MNVREMRAATAAAGAMPGGKGRTQAFPAREMRASMTKRDGKDFYLVEGYASVVERSYRMWDWYGEYDEIVSAGAFDKTLAAGPDTVWLTNHKGVTMARTTNGTLELAADSTGLWTRAYLNPTRQDVRDTVSAIEDGLMTEMSFAFMITSGQWSPEYDEYRINEVDIDRGDVSGVNYGASPHTSIAARSAELLRVLDDLPPAAQRAAYDRLASRMAERPAERAPETSSEPRGSVALKAKLRAALDA